MKTLYEATVSNGTTTYLLVYSARLSRAALHAAVTKHAATMVKLTGDNQIHYADRAQDGATMGDWTIKYSGRTEREAKRDPHTWIGDLNI